MISQSIFSAGSSDSGIRTLALGLLGDYGGQETLGNRDWAVSIRERATEENVKSLVSVLSDTSVSCQARKTDVMVVCATLLNHYVSEAGSDAFVFRAGIIALIDHYVMQIAEGDRT